ncbi:restriction endonuclease subunit S [Methanosarcina sp. WWM596]|uniref:restriction endonuclease subunit S n=1 Tax=Methanosarcina sp. WWM596 TaxID=1434103 RepID=UPI0006156A66|nr:restriction endonuclease subunit S [Methanosarcina sp. WWM596]AKB18159.1 Type I restriction-modification system, specificity subunit S [Methanosarcina sp. WWM596]
MTMDQVSLGEICKEIYRYPTYYGIEYLDIGVPEVRGELITADGNIDLDRQKWRFISKTTASKFPRTSLEEGDLVMSVRGTIGKVGIVPRELCGANITANLIRMSPNKQRVYERYLWLYMRSPEFLNSLDNESSSTTIKTIKAPNLKALRIPLPPLTDQQRIADILDRAEALRAKRRAALAQLDELIQSIYIDIFGDAVSNPVGWQRYPLKNCIKHVQIGPFGSLLHKEDYVYGGIPLINPMHIEDGKIIPDPNQSITMQKHAELQLYQLRQGDVIMGRRGEMGRCAIVGPEHDGMLCGTGSLFIRPDESKATATYLQATLSSSSMRKRLEDFSLGATLPNLNRGIVEELAISLPPIELQHEYAHRIAAVEKLKTAHKASFAELDLLFASLQYRAFKGEL